MTLKDDLAADMLATFLNSDEFAREIVYIPRGVEGNKRTIRAIVDWGDDIDGPQFLGPEVSRSEAVITVANSPTEGVDKPDEAADRFELPVRHEGRVERYSIKRTQSADAGAWQLLLQVDRR